MLAGAILCPVDTLAPRRGCRGGERKALSAPAGAPPCPRRGLTRRLRRGKRAGGLMGRSIALGGDPKGVQGGERKATLLARRETTLP